MAWWIISNDAGGAEVLSCWIKQELPIDQCRFILEGPAVRIFEKNLGPIPIQPCLNLAQLLPQDFVLTSTGWMSDLEKKSIQTARHVGARCYSFLDHWAHYAERFTLNGTLILPDEIWVGDPYAEKLAKQTFLGSVVILKENYYLKNICDRVIELEKNLNTPPTDLLFICEAATESFPEWSTSNDLFEFRAIRKFIDWFMQEYRPIASKKTVLKLRLHPAESPTKYDQFLKELKETYGNVFDLVLSGPQIPLERDISSAAWVGGLYSMALVIAVLCGRKVVSSIPAGGPPHSLPFSGIVNI